MSKLDEAVSLVYSKAWQREPKSVPFTETDVRMSKQQIKGLILELIGEDKDPDTSGRGFKTGYVTRENKFRAELRKKVEEL